MSTQQAIKKLCDNLDINQKQLAEKIGITRSSIGHYYHGRRMPLYPIISRFIKLANKHKIKLKADDFLE